MILSPTQSSKNVTFRFKYFSSYAATGLKDNFGTLYPLGLPICESNTRDLGLRFRTSWIVGIVSKYFKESYILFSWGL